MNSASIIRTGWEGVELSNYGSLRAYKRRKLLIFRQNQPVQRSRAKTVRLRSTMTRVWNVFASICLYGKTVTYIVKCTCTLLGAATEAVLLLILLSLSLSLCYHHHYFCQCFDHLFLFIAMLCCTSSQRKTSKKP